MPFARTFKGLAELTQRLKDFAQKSGPTTRFVLILGDTRDGIGSSIITNLESEEEAARLSASVLGRLKAMAARGEILS